MPFTPEYRPGEAIPRTDSIAKQEDFQTQPEQKQSLENETAAYESLNQAARDVVEQTGGDAEVVELLHLLGNELDMIAYYETGGDSNNVESKKSLLKRALRAAAESLREEIGRG